MSKSNSTIIEIGSPFSLIQSKKSESIPTTQVMKITIEIAQNYHCRKWRCQKGFMTNWCGKGLLPKLRRWRSGPTALVRLSPVLSARHAHVSHPPPPLLIKLHNKSRALVCSSGRPQFTARSDKALVQWRLSLVKAALVAYHSWRSAALGFGFIATLPENLLPAEGAFVAQAPFTGTFRQNFPSYDWVESYECPFLPFPSKKVSRQERREAENKAVESFALALASYTPNAVLISLPADSNFLRCLFTSRLDFRPAITSLESASSQSLHGWEAF